MTRGQFVSNHKLLLCIFIAVCLTVLFIYSNSKINIRISYGQGKLLSIAKFIGIHSIQCLEILKQNIRSKQLTLFYIYFHKKCNILVFTVHFGTTAFYNAKQAVTKFEFAYSTIITIENRKTFLINRFKKDVKTLKHVT